MIKAVLFDMDGLMIDSEPYHQKAFDAALREVGSSLSEEENTAHYVGISDKDAAQDMIRRKGLALTTDQLVTRKLELYRQYIQTEIIAKPGLLELLQFLTKNNIKKAVASSSSIEDIRAVVDHLEILHYFDALCSATQVAKGKPAPDIFLFASSKLAIPPHECLVLEDAPSGLAAGKSAGMTVIVIPSRETMGRDFSTADYMLGSLSEVPKLLEETKIISNTITNG